MDIVKVIVGPLQTNCYLAISGEEAAIIDPGDELERITNEISGLKIIFIILTHYHFDHVTAALNLKQKTSALIAIHEHDKDFLSDFIPDISLREGDIIKIGKESLKVIHTPGHTKGSICLLGKGFILTGDTLFRDGCGRTDLPGGSMEDMKKTLRKIGKITSGIMVYPGHGEVFEGKQLTINL